MRRSVDLIFEASIQLCHQNRQRQAVRIASTAAIQFRSERAVDVGRTTHLIGTPQLGEFRRNGEIFFINDRACQSGSAFGFRLSTVR